MDAYIIVGEAKSLKSSVIRSLTGCRISGPRDFAFVTGKVQRTYVRIASVQEGKPGLTPRQFAAQVSKSNATATVFALRARRFRQLPDADAYLDYFVNVAGWNLVQVAILNNSSNPLQTPLASGRFKCYSFSPTPPVINLLAASVRKQFGWL